MVVAVIVTPLAETLMTDDGRKVVAIIMSVCPTLMCKRMHKNTEYFIHPIREIIMPSDLAHTKKYVKIKTNTI